MSRPCKTCRHDQGEHELINNRRSGACLLEVWKFDEWVRCDCEKFLKKTEKKP